MDMPEVETWSRRFDAQSATTLLDSPRERRFERITRLAAAAVRVPVAIELAPAAPAATGVTLCQLFCRHVATTGVLLVVNDARLHPVPGNATLEHNPAVGAFLGIPLFDQAGATIGTLYAIDSAPRHWSEDDLDTLADAAALAQRHIADRAEYDALAAAELAARSLLNEMPHMIWTTAADGQADGFNERWYSFTGTSPDSSNAQNWADMAHPDDRATLWPVWQRCIAGARPFTGEFRLRHHSGGYRWVLARALPLRGEDGRITSWFGSCTDIQTVRDSVA